MTPETLEFFARNTGDYYAEHCELAKSNAPLERWEQHIRVRVLPRYRREENEPYEGLSRLEIKAAAAALKVYYKRKLTEGA